MQLRRQARLRREYLYRKGLEERERAIQERKDKLKKAVQGTDMKCDSNFYKLYIFLLH